MVEMKREMEGERAESVTVGDRLSAKLAEERALRRTVEEKLQPAVYEGAGKRKTKSKKR